MPGYEFLPLVRIKPSTGNEVTLDLGRGLTDVPRPLSARLSWGYDIEKRVAASKKLRPRRKGMRPVVTVTLLAAGAMADTAVVAQIVNAALNDTITTEISLDNGTVWREMLLTKFEGPTPTQNKSRAGATFVLEFTAVDVVWEAPALASGS